MLPSIKDLSYADLRQWLAERQQPAFRAKQIQDWLFKKHAVDFNDMANLPLALRQSLTEHFRAFTLTPLKTQEATDETIKWLSQLGDGETIETVLIRAPERDTVCISSQVGCAVRCIFCASGKQGLVRNLSSAEILDQVILASRAVGRLVNNVVVMGMGEPLHNFDQLVAALKLLCSADGLGLGARHVTISTSGVPAAIRRLAELQTPWNLALSLHAVNDEARAKIIPPAKRNPLEDIFAACEYYMQKTNRMMTLEYILLDGRNCQPEDASRLVDIAHRLHAKVNLIPCNNDSGPCRAPDDELCERFLRLLLSRKVHATLRRRKGKDIQAACGQLRSQAPAAGKGSADTASAAPPSPASNRE